MNINITEKQQELLLKMARDSILFTLKTKKRLLPQLPEDDFFKQDFAVFVTLKQAENLRGCIGQLEAREPLYLAINNMAFAAAFEDHRFSPVTKEEFDDISIEISILTPLQRIDDYRKIKLGIDGVWLKKGWKSGVFLPQVAEETGWDLDTFLQYLCAHKAFLLPDAYKNPETEIFVFQVIKFQEKRE
jgi:AmmeMemoRadiSam system protein A